MLDGSIFKQIIGVTVQKISSIRKTLDEINVFPIPDGDTGANVYNTLNPAYEVIATNSSNNLRKILNQFCQSLLYHSKGNSGVIITQFFIGINNYINTPSISFDQFINSLNQGSQYAYKSIEAPQEGTILSVMKISGDPSVYVKNNQLSEDIFKLIYIKSCQSTINTRSQLSNLQKANVIDSGAYAYLQFIESIYTMLSQESTESKMDLINHWHDELNHYIKPIKLNIKQSINPLDKILQQDNIKFPYCTECILTIKDNLSSLKQHLNQFGDSIILVQNENQVKIHIHTNIPEDLIDYLNKQASVNHVKIEDMNIQHHHFIENTIQKELLNTAIVPIVDRKEIFELIKSLDHSQSIYPIYYNHLSYTDLLIQFSMIPSNSLIIVYNNSQYRINIDKASQLTYKENNTIQTKNIPQIISAIMDFNHDEDIQTIISQITQAMNSVITFNVFSEAHSNEYYSQFDDAIIESGTPSDVIPGTINKLMRTNISLITIYTTNNSQNEIRSAIKKSYPTLELEWINYSISDSNYTIVME